VVVFIIVQGEKAVARLHLPETDTSRHIVLAIANSLKVTDRSGNVSSISQRDEKWSCVCGKRSVVHHSFVIVIVMRWFSVIFVLLITFLDHSNFSNQHYLCYKRFGPFALTSHLIDTQLQ